MAKEAPAPPVPIDGDEHLTGDAKQTRKDKFLIETGLAKKPCDVHSHATSKWFYIKHVGFNNIDIHEGRDVKGPKAYHVDVKAKFAGWDITLRRPTGEPIMHLRKDITFARLLGWDKGTKVDIHLPEPTAPPAPPTLPALPAPPVSQEPREQEAGQEDNALATGASMKSISSAITTTSVASGGTTASAGTTASGTTAASAKNRAKLKAFFALPSRTRKSIQTRQKLEGDPQPGEVIVPEMGDDEYKQMDDKALIELPAMKVTTIQREHAMRSNENVFEYRGKLYAWNYWVFLGSNLKLTDLETKEELANVHLRPTWTIQIITSWSWRLDGTLEIKEEAVRNGMEDIIVATLTAMLEWRKHNNKVWIVAAAIA